MDHEAKLKRLEDMAGARLSAMRARALRETALELLTANGTVTLDEVSAKVDETFVKPSSEQMLSAMVQKAGAAVDYARQVRDSEQDRLRGLQEKVDKYQGLLDRAKADLAAYHSTADEDLEDAIEFADYLEGLVS